MRGKYIIIKNEKTNNISSCTFKFHLHECKLLFVDQYLYINKPKLLVNDGDYENK